ncbi:MAG: hypothetical protein ABIF71_05870 [Planctomycetota bacterium]
MRYTKAWLYGAGIGVLSGIIIGVTPIQESVIQTLVGAGPRVAPVADLFLRFPWIVAAAGGSLIAGISSSILWRLPFPKVRAAQPADDKTATPGDTIYRHLQERIAAFGQILKQREGTKHDTRLTTSGGAPEDFEEIYRRRRENLDFLEAMITNLCRQESLPPKDYQSGERPELLVEEVRGLLQRTLYRDYLQFHDQVQPRLHGEKLTWQEFDTGIEMIGRFARSLKTSFEFYLDMCRNEKNKFAKFDDYGVLPLAVGDPGDADLFQFISEQRLGPKFDYGQLAAFKERARELGVYFNPSIPDAFDIFDRCIGLLHRAINFHVARAKRLFNVYMLSRTEAYIRITWIRQNLAQFKPEAVAYYLDSLKMYRKEYDRMREEYGTGMLPEGMLAGKDIEQIQAQLEAIASQGPKSTVVYKSAVIRKGPNGK